MAQSQQGDSGSPFPSIILVLVMSAGAFWVQKVPLPSARPAEPMVTPERYPAQQDIDSRLWQDPFEAVKKAKPKSDPVMDADIKQALLKLSGVSQTSKPAIGVQNDLCKDLSPIDQVRVMAVTVNGAPYAEAAEARRRTRYAVVSGLGRSDYVPRDREHIGRITANIGDQSTRISPVVVPFEWFQHASKIEERVLVLWINETQIRDQPLERLQQVIEKACSTKQELQTMVIGPGSSDTLAAMLREAKRLSDLDKCSVQTPDTLRKFLTGLQIYSPKATAPDQHLLQSVDLSKKGSGNESSYCRDPSNTVASAFKAIFPGLQFQRTISTDCELMGTLIRELDIRGVDADDGIVLISEWDTSYGRALPKAFEEVLKKKPAEKNGSSDAGIVKNFEEILKTISEFFKVENKNVTPIQTLRHYSYLRGLDGMLPGENADKKSDENKKTREKDAEAIESAFGNHQKDYLRRIAARVDDLDHEMKDGGKKEGVKAIGILGSDVYDKLLILRALRVHFPEVIFFTTDLDAGLLHAEEWDSARNLVVASGYGLRLDGGLQREIPPFRDSYQTAYFQSVLAALMELSPQKKALEAVKRGSSAPRIFEIGRSQAVDLSENIRESNKDSKCTLDDCSFPHPYVKTPTPPPLGKLTIFIVLLLLGWWYLYRKQVADFFHRVGEDASATLKKTDYWYSHAHYLGFHASPLSDAPPEPKSRKKLSLLKSRWVLGALFGSLLFIWLSGQVHVMWHDIFSRGTAGGGEPFSWYEGVSIWPSALLRIFTGLLALSLLALGMHRLRQNDERLTDLFFREHRNTVLAQARPSLGVRIWHVFKRKRIGRCWFQTRFGRWLKGRKFRPRQALLIWRNTVQPRSRAALFVRMLFGVAVLMTAAYLLLALLPSEPPNAPFRGSDSKQVHYQTIFFAVFSFIFLLVFVIDSTRRTCCLATCLGERSPTKWPKDMEQWFGCQHRQLPLCGEVEGSRYRDDWLDIQLIAARTVVVGGFIYYPFLILSLLILGRSSFFDNLQIPVGLGTLFITYLIMALACALSLRHAAERARRHALRNLSEEMVQAVGNDACKQQLEQMKFIKESILAEHRGAFASFLQQPWLKALLLPLGSFSGVQLLESLSLLSL